MAVVDLDNVELLDNARVEAHLLGFKARENCLAKVDSEAVVKLGLTFQVSFKLLKFALDCVHISRVFEKRVHSLLALLDVVDVSLGLLDFVFHGLNTICNALELR